MDRTAHGGDLYGRRAALDFSSNISPLGLPETVGHALVASMEAWDNYPDPFCRDLTAALAQHEAVPKDWIHFGNGAADLIFRFVQALRPRRALTLAPTFSEYERALAAVGCSISYHTLYEKDAFRLTETIIKKINPALDVVILCNPNNPTGQPADQALLLRILKRCEACRVVLLIDECFISFLDDPNTQTMKEFLAAYPNLAILRAFTKLYALAGLRLGYLLCADGERLHAMSICEPPWNISVPAQIAGVAALADEGYVARVRQIVRQERGYLTQALDGIGAVVFGSRANYIFFKLNACRDLEQRLAEHGIMIRPCGNYRGLDNRFYRAAVKMHNENEQLIAAIGAVLGEM
ncbi:hypothetical protein B5F55_02770 [Anaerotruncus colihominis]|uniref:pyridoxal phosphate-dependent aminotransferase n=1 Tax=Anaerotruncus colihominis TaxID=169435 RepID=UPI000B394E4B|nr:histidinol-phosphate transaminase [Anaerotruncus colihominis]OUO69153.1 hypothetical protein B5F55_02770 [Anaerotruncus colihominis]